MKNEFEKVSAEFEKEKERYRQDITKEVVC